MNNAKKVLHLFTAIVLLFLTFCTFMARYVAVSFEPVVETVNPIRMELIV